MSLSEGVDGTYYLYEPGVFVIDNNNDDENLEGDDVVGFTITQAFADTNIEDNVIIIGSNGLESGKTVEELEQEWSEQGI